jgi:hypothetical protein
MYTSQSSLECLILSSVDVFLTNAECFHCSFSNQHLDRDTVPETCVYTVSVCVTRGGDRGSLQDTRY